MLPSTQRPSTASCDAALFAKFLPLVISRNVHGYATDYIVRHFVDVIVVVFVVIWRYLGGQRGDRRRWVVYRDGGDLWAETPALAA